MMEIIQDNTNDIAINLTSVINVKKIVSIHYFEFNKDFHFTGELHNYWELVYVDSGNVLISAGNKNHVLKQGEIIFHKPNEFHTISADKVTPSNVVVVSFVATSKSMSNFRNKKTFLPKDLRPSIKTIIDEGKKTFKLPFNDVGMGKMEFSDKPPFGGLQMIKNALEHLLIMLIREEMGEPTKKTALPDADIDDPIVSSVIHILNDNLYSRITVEQICKQLSYSKTYVSKIFKENCGCTIIDFYTKLKIGEAKTLIRRKSYNLTQISNMLCFDNPRYFSKVFKKVANMTPSEYINSIS